MDERKSSRKLRWLVWAVALLIVLAVAYPVSFGPAGYCVVRGWMPLEPFVAVYEPLSNILDGTPLYKPMDRYINWWLRLAMLHERSD